MNINAINSMTVSYGSRPAKVHASKENSRFSDSFKNMWKSPVYDDAIVDTDEMDFRRGVEDFQSDTIVRTLQNNEDNMIKDFEKSAGANAPKAKPAQITTPAQARNIEKFIEELELLKLTNSEEAFNIGGQISRLKSMLRRYYKSAARSIK